MPRKRSSVLPGFYAHLMANELLEVKDLPASVRPLLKSFEACKARLTTTLKPGVGVAVAWNGTMPGIGALEVQKFSKEQVRRGFAASGYEGNQ